MQDLENSDVALADIVGQEHICITDEKAVLKSERPKLQKRQPNNLSSTHRCNVYWVHE